jgi:hypothetical protein
LTFPVIQQSPYFLTIRRLSVQPLIAGDCGYFSMAVNRAFFFVKGILQHPSNLNKLHCKLLIKHDTGWSEINDGSLPSDVVWVDNAYCGIGGQAFFLTLKSP